MSRFRRYSRTALLMALVTAVGCPSAPPAPAESRDFTRFHAMMGTNQKLVFSLQSYAGDPIEPAAIRGNLETLATHFETTARLAPYGDPEKDERLRGWSAQIGRQMRDLAAAAWTTDSRKELFQKLTATCTRCHAAFPYSRALPAATLEHAALIRQPSAESCGKCHAEVLAEWKGTLHATAWQDPVFVASAGRPMKMECKPCHSPQPMLFSDLATGPDARPFLRDFNHADSVNCVSCHLREDGTVAARQTRGDAPCRPVRDARLSSTALCGTCHNPTHGANDEWERSQAHELGVACNDCHAPLVYRTGADGRKKSGVSHVFPGGNDLEFVRKAVATACSLRGRELTVRVENRTAHKFPGEVPTRIFLVRIQFWDRDATLVAEETLTYRRPAKGEVGWKDNRFEPDEVKSINRALPEQTTRVRVEFLFQNGPFALFDKAMTLGRWESDLK